MLTKKCQVDSFLCERCHKNTTLKWLMPVYFDICSDKSWAAVRSGSTGWGQAEQNRAPEQEETATRAKVCVSSLLKLSLPLPHGGSSGIPVGVKDLDALVWNIYSLSPFSPIQGGSSPLERVLIFQFFIINEMCILKFFCCSCTCGYILYSSVQLKERIDKLQDYLK